MDRRARARKALGVILRFAFVAIALTVLSRQVSWVELRASILNIDRGWALLAVAFYGPAILLLAVRLSLLLRDRAARFSYRTVLFLTFSGNLLNLVLPGGNGGDIYKAVHLARLSGGRGTESVTVLLVDRLIGLASFFVLALVGIALSWNERLGSIWRAVGLILLGALALGTAYASPAIRRLVRWDAFVARLPFAAHVTRVDATLMGLREHPTVALRALGLAVVAQLLVAASLTSLGLACGIDPTHGEGMFKFAVACTLAYSVSTIASAIPITIQGFGLTEAIFYRILVKEGWCSLTEVVAITLTFRLIALLWSLPGALTSLMTLAPARPVDG